MPLFIYKYITPCLWHCNVVTKTFANTDLFYTSLLEMAQLPSQPWEADREHNAPDRLDKCWGSISHDINSTISSLFKEVERVKDSAGLPDFNIEFSAASAQQNDNEMLLSLKAAKDKFSEMEDKFRKILQNKPFIITEEDVTGWLNDATTAHQSVDQYLSISGHKLFMKIGLY